MERSIDLLSRQPPAYDKRIHYGSFASQFGDLRLPTGKGPFPVVVGIHGGWWRAAHGLETQAHLCAALTAEGYATWNIEYRRIGEKGGGWPGTLFDVGSAVDWLYELKRTFPLDLSRTSAVGFSAGGHLALWAAARHKLPTGHPLNSERPFPLRGVVALAGAADLAFCAELQLSQGIVETFLGGTPAQFPDRYAACSPSELLPLAVPQTLIHGLDDSSVPHEVSRRYHAKAVACGDDCQLVLLPHIQHFELIDPLSDAWSIVRSCIMERT